MVDTILNTLGGLLTRTFLFASFLPAFFLATGNLLIAVLVIGPTSIATWFGTLDGSIQSLASAALFIITFLIAYIFSSLRGLMLQLWSGTLVWVPLLTDYLIRRKQKEFLILNDAKFAKEPWAEEDEALRQQTNPHWSLADADRSRLDNDGHQKIARIIAKLDREIDPTKFRATLENDIVPLFKKYNGDDLCEFFQQVRSDLLRRREEAGTDIYADRIRQDLDYGSYALIRPTRLGNIVEAYNDYPYKRYGLSGVLFWPRLAQVTPDSFNERIQDKKAFLDFALAMATGAILSAFMVPIYAPFLDGNIPWIVWVATSLGLATVGGIFYTAALTAAQDFGHTLRAACDLFRLDLMAALGRPRPIDLSTERKQWVELSQLAAYGTIDNFTLSDPKAGP